MRKLALKAILRALHEAPAGLTYAELRTAAHLNPRGRYIDALVFLNAVELVQVRGGTRYVLNEAARGDIAELLGASTPPGCDV